MRADEDTEADTRKAVSWTVRALGRIRSPGRDHKARVLDAYSENTPLGGWCFVSKEKLAAVCGISLNSFTVARKRLVKLGALQMRLRAGYKNSYEYREPDWEIEEEIAARNNISTHRRFVLAADLPKTQAAQPPTVTRHSKSDKSEKHKTPTAKRALLQAILENSRSVPGMLEEFGRFGWPIVNDVVALTALYLTAPELRKLPDSASHEAVFDASSTVFDRARSAMHHSLSAQVPVRNAGGLYASIVKRGWDAHAPGQQALAAGQQQLTLPTVAPVISDNSGDKEHGH